jgi:hypothetical protein
MIVNYTDIIDDKYIQSTLSTPPNFSRFAVRDNSESVAFTDNIKNLFLHNFPDCPDKEKLSGYYYSVFHREVVDTYGYGLPIPAKFNINIKPSSEFYDIISSKFPQNSVDIEKIYPTSVRYTNGNNIFLVERPPFYANIQYNTSKAYRVNTKNDKTIQMWIPWTAMLIYMNPSSSYYQASLYFNDGPINSLDDLAVPCFHMNMYDDGKMCLNQSSLMLQQHLAQIQSYSINEIYNFLINDYMSGGWNADLGVNSFERLAFHSSSLKSIQKICYQTGSLEKNINPPITARGSVSYPKYYTNYLNYFSSLSLEETLDLISSVKSELSDSPTYRKMKYSDVIQSYKVDLYTPFSILSDNYYGTAFNISNNYNIFIDYKYGEEIYKVQNNYLKHIYQVLLDYNNLRYSELLNNQQNLNLYIDNNVYENPVLLIDKDLNVIEINQDFDYSYISNIFLQKVV